MAETPGTPAGPDPDNQAPRPEEAATEREAAALTARPSVSPTAPAPQQGAPAVPAPSPAVSPAPAAGPAEPAEAPPAEAPPEEASGETLPSAVKEPASAQEPAGIAATVHVPPVADAEAGSAAEGEEGEEGGEWHLLVGKVRDWIENAELRKQWERLRGPLRGLALLIGLILVLRLYGSVVATIDALPLISGLLELVGLIAVLRFSTTRLVRAEERERVFREWGRAWQQFRGRL